MDTNLPKPFRIETYDKLITDIAAEYPSENFLGKLEKKLLDLDLSEDVISILITNSNAQQWPAFVNKRTSNNNKPQRNENIENLKLYKCML